MRIAFISDLHGNLTALEAVLADIESMGVDQLVCLGDAATLGPRPIEILQKLQALKCTYIMGNHDLALLEPSRAAEYEIASHLWPDLNWCRERLKEENFEFIRSFKMVHEIKLPNGLVVCCYHGSPRSTTDLLLATTPQEDLENYLSGFSADVYIGGHSHIQLHRRFGNKLLVNSGSVGNAFVYAYSPGVVPRLLPWAEYAIIEQNDQSLNVNLRRINYDTQRLLEEVRKSELPGSAWWFNQFKDG